MGISRTIMKAKTMLEALHHVRPSRGIFPNSKNCFKGQDHSRNPSCRPFLGTLNSLLEEFGQIHTVFGGILTKHKNLQPIVIPFFKMPYVFFFCSWSLSHACQVSQEKKQSTQKNHLFVSHVIPSATCITGITDHTRPQALSTHKYLLQYL